MVTVSDANPICPDLIANGICHRKRCAANHDVHRCESCRSLFSSLDELQQHESTRKHSLVVEKQQRRASSESGAVRCIICDVYMNTARGYAPHSRGKRHRSRLEGRADPGPEDVELVPGQTPCDICETIIPKGHWNIHIKGLRHRNAMTYTKLESAINDTEQDKNGIVVAGGETDVDFGVVEPETVSNEYTLLIENTGASSTFLKARLSSQLGRRPAHIFDITYPDIRDGVLIRPQHSLNIIINFNPNGQRGRFSDRIELIFEDQTLHQRFVITRPITAISGNKDDYEALKPTAPYVRPKRQKDEIQVTDPVAGVAPPALAAVKWKVSLPLYPMNKPLVKLAYADGGVREVAKRVRERFLPNELTPETYSRWFNALLFIEEERARIDLQQYDMKGALLDRCPNKKHFRLTVEGLAEKRPSVIVTDRFFVRPSNSPGDRWWEGHVHHVNERSVDLQFHSSFSPLRGQKFDVRFDLNRITYRRMHQALDTAFVSPRVLFPDAGHVKGLKIPTMKMMGGLNLIDRKIANNPPQLRAIAAIVSRPPGSPPLVVFGPPGTGKTVTIVEAIRQLLIANPNARVLACAPSNSASDLIAERLATGGLTEKQLFRLVAPSRSANTIPTSIHRFTRKNTDGVFCIPPLDQLKTFKVVVSTCLSSCVPYGVGVPQGHFSHIFIDEVGQATEPEVMIAVKTIAGKDTNVIISGDNKQLGPIVRSAIARELGLDVSYLDRLTSHPVYDEETGKDTTIVKLTKNWRSHIDILKFPNEKFYKGELEACADQTITHSLLRWDYLVKQNFPIVFHGINGKDEREASSPSFFNRDEASLVRMYVQHLFEDRRLRLKPEHIGVISPYYAQVCKIRSILTGEGKKIRVGSVEEFQGQERRVIIISTVRSSLDFVNFDLRHTLGFVANPRRFNVAITRAQALLIVVGDPTVLALDPLWKSFINHVHIQGGYKGKYLDWDPTEPINDDESAESARRRTTELSEKEVLLARLRADVAEHNEDLQEGYDEELEGNVERPWREID